MVVRCYEQLNAIKLDGKYFFKHYRQVVALTSMIYSNRDIVLVSLIALSLFIFTKNSSAETGDSAAEVDWSKTKIWGPGLKSGFIVPARYFFLQLKTSSGEK